MSVRSAARLRLAANPPAGQAGRPASDLGTRRRQQATRRRLVVYGLRLLLGVAILAGWEVGARVGVIDKFFWSQPSDIAATLSRWVTEGTDLGPLSDQVLVTMEETVGGFIVGSIFGVVFGVVLGSNRLLSDVLSPYIKGANAIPRVVVGALFAVSLGLDIKSKIATASVLVFFVVFFNAFQGVREVDRNLVANARILGANTRQLTTEIVIPSALSWIVASLHTSFSFALVGAVVGEFLGSTEGLGLMIQTAQGTFNANGVFAAMVILAAVALIMEALVTTLENRLITWRPNVGNEVTI